MMPAALREAEVCIEVNAGRNRRLPGRQVRHQLGRQHRNDL